MVAHHTITDPTALRWNVWAYSDWLISYAGGFVRRGLAGHIFATYLNGLNSLSALNVFIFGTFTLFAVLFVAHMLLATRHVGLVLMTVLAPANLFAMALRNEYYYRKEMLFYLPLLCVALAFPLTRHRNQAISVGVRTFLLGVLVVTSMVGVLIHEAFLFMAMPAYALCVWAITHPWGVRSATYITALFGALHMGLFAAMVWFKGTPETAHHIWNSLSAANITLMVPPPAIPQGPTLAIEVIGSSLTQGIWAQQELLSSGSVFHAFVLPFIFLVGSTAALGILHQRWATQHTPPSLGWSVLLFMVLFTGSLPLYVIGMDWGRWMVSTNLMFLIIYAMGCRTPFILPVEYISYVQTFMTGMTRYLHRITTRWSVPVLVVFIILGGTVFRLPECLAPLYHTSFRRKPVLVTQTVTPAAPVVDSHERLL